MENPMHLIQTNGKQIAYTTGLGGIVEGRETLVFVHGSGGSHLQWNYQRSFFQKRCNVLLIDLPGHGEAGHLGETSVEAYATQVLQLVQTVSEEPICLFGHSLGGAIAQSFALSYPDRVKALGLVGTGARLRVLPAILRDVQEAFDDTIRMINEYAFSGKAPSDLIDLGIRTMLKTDPAVLYGDFSACDRFDVMDRVSEIVVPTLVITGRDDRLTPPKYAHYLADRIENATLEIIEGAGHMVMIEQHNRFNKRVLRFLKTLE
jgi:pimeloyl-ACP methyl ester carboxylesterase